MPEPEDSRPRSRSQGISLDNLYLDPNNYRFIENADYRQVPDDKITAPDIQRRTTAFLLGKRQENVKDLIDSLRQNGWLDLDAILVRQLGRGRYLVLEGNRRVATLKHLKRRYEEAAIDLGQLDVALFDRVPTRRYDSGSESARAHHLMMMGLHHLAGKKRWPSINQATLLRDLLKEKGDAKVVRQSLGLKARTFNLSLRTLTFCELYKASEYGDQFTADMFTMFQEVLKAPSLRTWLGIKFSNTRPMEVSVAHEERLARLFSWFSDEQDELTEEQESHYLGPVLTTFQNVRELGKFIDDSAAIKRLDETRSLSDAMLDSDLVLKREVERILSRGDEVAKRLFSHSRNLNEEDIDKIESLTNQLQGVVQQHGRASLTPTSKPWAPFNELTRRRFLSLNIEQFRRLNQLELVELRPINLLIGANNTGKTSLLEAIYLLTRLNDDRALVETIERRARLQLGRSPARWLTDQLPESITISGRFDDFDDNLARVHIESKHEPSDLSGDQSAYLRSLVLEAQYAGQSQSTRTAFQDGRPRRTRYNGDRWLCRSVFSSPYAFAGSQLAEHNEQSFKHKSKGEVLDFIREHLDSGIADIELLREFKELGVFSVQHDHFDQAVDLSSFGQGLRRVFAIGLAFATARDGVLLIDEMEAGLHMSLLPKMAQLIEALAQKFKVQVFISTHSKDTINAISQHTSEGMVANFVLRRTQQEQITNTRIDGERLARMIKAGDVDLRGLL